MVLTSLDKDNVNRLMKSLSIVKLDNDKYEELKRYNTTTISKLQMIAEQIEYLQNQAKYIKLELNKNYMKLNVVFQK